MKGYQVARLVAYVTGLVNQELLLQVEYLAAENRILRAHAPARLRAFGRRALHACRDRQTAWPKGSGESSPGGKTRDHPRLVSSAGGAELRWLEAPLLPGSAED